MKIISFNIEGYNSNRANKYAWKYRSEIHSYIINKYDPDIICLQEAENENIEFYSSNFSHYQLHKGFVAGGEDIKKEIYNPIFWKKNIFDDIEHGSFYLSGTPDEYSKSWDSKSIRNANWINLLNKNSKLSFICLNTHLDNLSAQARLESSKLIIKKINLLFSQINYPIIIAGDFNSRPWMPPNEGKNTYPFPVIYSALPSGKEVYNTYLNHGFIDTYFYSYKSNILDMNTYHDYHGAAFPPAGLRIDWVLKKDPKGKLYGVNYSIIKDSLNTIYPSDHYPILVEFCENNYNMQPL